MTSHHENFLGEYKAISAKLKRRFLKKPNVSEASQRFGELARSLERDECPHYAAFCYLAVARCENTIGNADEESLSLVKAARLFIESEQLNHDLNCPGYSENLNGALSCFNHAIKVYQEQHQTALASSLCLEAAITLVHLDKFPDSIAYFQKAAVMLNRCPMSYLDTLKRTASIKLKIGDLDGALNLLTEVCAIVEERGIVNGKCTSGAYSEILRESEITKVLLIMLLKPTPQKLGQANAKTLEKYSFEKFDPVDKVPYLEEELYILMQSLVVASNMDETDTMKALQSDLWCHLNSEQNDLLHRIITKINS